MKRYICAALALLMLVSLSGCGCTAQPVPETSAPPVTTVQTTAPATETTLPETTAGAQLEPQVIYDQEGVKITVTGLQDDWMGTKVNLQVENNTDRNLALSGDVFAVNGVTVSGYLYAEVAAGMKTNDSLELYSDALDTANILQIATIRAQDARLVDTDSYDVVAKVPMELATDLAEGYQQGIDDTGEVVFQQDGITVIAQIISEDLTGKSVRLLVKNETGKDLIVEGENISVNGFTLDAWLYEVVCADTVRYCEMDLFSSGLEENGIQEIEQVSFRLRFLNAANLETVTQSEPLEIFARG